MRVIIKDRFYDFQNPDTEEIFSRQKAYLASLVEKHAGQENIGELLTNLLSLQNLTEVLIDGIVTNHGLDKTVDVLNARPVE